MLTVLAGPLPIAARGAAMASLLLSDGTGPLHNHRSPLDLGAAVREATRQMDPLGGARLSKLTGPLNPADPQIGVQPARRTLRSPRR